MKLKDKVAIVTGSGQGIGEAIAKKLASEGASIVVDDVVIERANRVVQEIKTQGGNAIAFKASVINRNEVQDMVKTTMERFESIHILVNNAGARRHESLLELTEEDWDIVLDVCLKGVFNCTQAVLKHMMTQQYGKIVNISSVAGIGAGHDNPGNYAAAKAGVVALTKVTAREAGPYGINVNCVAPGFIATPSVYENLGRKGAENHIERRKNATVLRRVGSPEDVANLVLFLVSDDSNYMSGQVIRVDGGRTDLL
jgi:NAD(P)-dependent dehydrogenase (short-subunit alcohol dehydrogenase family)